MRYTLINQQLVSLKLYVSFYLWFNHNIGDIYWIAFDIILCKIGYAIIRECFYIYCASLYNITKLVLYFI